MDTKKDLRSPSKGERTRQQIIDAACGIFMQQGYHAASTRQITEEIGLAPSALYNHFKQKDDIFKAVLEKYHPWMKIPAAVEEAEGESVDDIVRDAAARMQKTWEKEPDLIRLHLIELIEFRGQHLADLFDTTFSEMDAAITRLVEKRGIKEKIRTDVLIRSLLGLFFAYFMTDRYSGMQFTTSMEQSPFDYFKDIYLQGAIINSQVSKKENINKKGE